MAAGDGTLEAKEERSSIRHRPHDENTLSVKTDNLQRANQIEYKCEFEPV